MRGALWVESALLQQPPRWIVASGHLLGVSLCRQPHDALWQIIARIRWIHCVCCGFVREEVGYVGLRFVIEAGDKRRDAGVGLDLRGVEIQLAAPDEAGFLAQVDDLLEE